MIESQKVVEVKQAAELPIIDQLLSITEPCNGEQYAFIEWAKSQKMDMTEHPLHFLFLDSSTDAARDGWKAGIAHCHTLIQAHNLEEPKTCSTVPSEVRGLIAQKLQERNKHLELTTARYYVDTVLDLLATVGLDKD